MSDIIKGALITIGIVMAWGMAEWLCSLSW